MPGYRLHDAALGRNGMKAPEARKGNGSRPKRKVLPYQEYRTCDICGKLLPRGKDHICESCTRFLRFKHIADL